jgi:CheY-like chemotaxis protein
MNTIGQIILVDDDHITNFLHENLIRKLKIPGKIVVKNNGLEALEYLNKLIKKDPGCPCIVLIDLNMPVMDGFEFMRLYKKKLSRDYIKVIVVSTSLSQKDIEKVKQCGDFLYINKPLTMEKVQEMFDKVLHPI